MFVRSMLIVAVPLAMVALRPGPAAAREPATASTSGANEMIRQLEDPHRQAAVADAMGAMMSAMLSMKAAPLARTMDAAVRSTFGNEFFAVERRCAVAAGTGFDGDFCFIDKHGHDS